MAPHSSTLAWKIPWMEEPGRLQSMGSLRVGHDWATSLSLFTFMHWRRKWQPTPVFLPGESQGRGNLAGCCPWGRTESDTTEATLQQQQQQVHCPFCWHTKSLNWSISQKSVSSNLQAPLPWSWFLPSGSVETSLQMAFCHAGKLISNQSRNFPRMDLLSESSETYQFHCT